MKSIAIGVHLRREHIEPLAEAVGVGDLFLSAIDVPEEQSLSDRDLLVRIASIRASLLERATFIAIRYGFTFRTVADAEAKCIARAAEWSRILTENASRVEFSLKVAAPGVTRPDRRDFKSGASYLRALHDARDAVTVPASFREACEGLIVPICVRHQWINRDAVSVELAGLIERESLSRLAEGGEALKRTMPDVPFLLSAPWPLEVFAHADHE